MHNERAKTIEPIIELMASVQRELYDWAARGTGYAGRRARVESVKLGKALKKFREESMKNGESK